MFDLKAIQAALAEFKLDAWLLYDFRGSNVLARRILDMPEGKLQSRRWFYCIPSHGEPQKLVHRIEPASLDHLPGRKHIYMSWQELEAGLSELVAMYHIVAMEYAPRASNPYIARVDAGTVELVHSLGSDIAPSGDLIQQFEATWDDEQIQMHLEVAEHTRAAFDHAFSFIASQVSEAGEVREHAVVERILDYFKQHRLIPDHPPTVAVGPHSGDPHYSPSPGNDSPIRAGDLVLIDLWAKLDKPRSVFSDLTRMAFVGPEVPDKYAKIFAVVTKARDAAIECVRHAFHKGHILQGWEVDHAARKVIDAAGYGPQFVHRTGHSIGQELHGNGANMDNLETHDTRRVLRRTCFSVEPGIYFADFGMRSEVNVVVDANGQVHVTGGDPQMEITPIL